MHQKLALADVVFVSLLSVAVRADASTLHLAAATFDPLLALPPVPAELRLTEPRAGSVPYIVQFEAAGADEGRRSLTTLGIDVVAYLPEDAWLVRMEPAQRPAVAALAAVRWVGVFEPAWRISPEIGRLEFLNPARREAVRPTLLVRVFADPAAAALRYRELGARILEWGDDGFQRQVVLEAQPALFPLLAREPLTWWIEERPEFRVWNNTTRWVVQSNQSGATPLWDRGLHGEGQIVTVMDTGLDYNSCFFRDTGNAPPSPTHRKVINYTDFGGNTHDGCGTGHGTHVSGTVAGDQSFINAGNLNHNGMAYAAKITMQDVGDDDFLSCLLGFLAVPASLTNAFNASYNLGGRIHTNSWGSTTNSYDAYCVNVDQFMWQHPDFLVLFANGNGGPGASTVGSPATAKNCVSVGATRQAPNQNTMAGYSSRGPTGDSRYKPTLTTPGGEDPTFITSADNNSGNPPSPTCNVQGSPFQGTSMATPAAAGLAALTRQYFVDGFYPLGLAGGSDPLFPSAALVKAVLINAATDMATGDIPNNNEGWGRLLLDDALYFEGETRELRVETHDGLTHGGSVSFTYNVEAGTEPLEITLVWTDFPAASGAGVTLVNDLDLIVSAPGGAQYRGNVFSGGQSATGGTADRRNVEECVRVQNPAAGDWTIEVQGINVPQGPEPFALCATGAFANWPEDAAAVGEDARTVDWRILAQEPNPGLSGTTLRFFAPEAAAASITVHDLAGRRIRTLLEGPVSGGEQDLFWDGRTEAGDPVPAGVYYVRLRAGGADLVRKVTMLP